MDLKEEWQGHYAGVPRHLEGLRDVAGVASVFNANIDAVLKVRPDQFSGWMKALGADEWQVLNKGSRRISEPVDVLRGFVECFSKGIAQEWLVSGEDTYAWMREHLGYDRLQMGGQGGIIANVMAVAGVRRVYAHCASLPAQQAALFLDSPNLLSTDARGDLVRAAGVDRAGDRPLMHWILEFDQGAELKLGGLSLVCPKSNRFIATYDPLNFGLAVDGSLDQALRRPENPLDVILLSGYQMLTEPLAGGKPGSGLARVHESWSLVEAWKAAHPGARVHFEFASTQDLKVRAALASFLAPRADSVGCNEQELIGILEALGEDQLARECQDLGVVHLFRGLLRVHHRLGLSRVQLHMFGLYLTLIRPELEREAPLFRPESNRDGMVFAATLAAAKAGTGSLERPENLLWAHGRGVSDHSLAELRKLDAHLRSEHGAMGLAETGVVRDAGFSLVAVPTILIERPVTLVGMGDTISSLSLVGLR